jgi:dihydrodipicolinate synthase/N-acetylneuraminate lyase
MAQPAPVVAKRDALREALFAEGIPALWCPALTHYDAGGRIDEARIAAHLRHLGPYVKGFLIPGSTGDGWELSKEETLQLIDIARRQAKLLRFKLLIGVLKPTTEQMLAGIEEIARRVCGPGAKANPLNALREFGICGFAVCPPHGQHLSQEEISAAFSRILDTGFPIAVYQLPQVTQNEISPEVVSHLAARFPNFLFFKDTSWTDRVPLSGQDMRGVFLVRGAEGDYARWLKPVGGPYDGFLLSTANCFGGELKLIIDDLSANRLDSARKLSDKLSVVIDEAFKLARTIPEGNPFANANKAIDHFFAYGPNALDASAPRLHSGGQLPVEMLRATAEILRRYGLMPAAGYL